MPRIVCANLRLKLGEQSGLPYLKMAVEIACFVITNFETLCYKAKFIMYIHLFLRVNRFTFLISVVFTICFSILTLF